MIEDKSTRYHRLRRRTALLGMVAGGVVLLLLLGTGASAWLSRGLAALTGDAPGSPAPLVAARGCRVNRQ